jgi:hypothetical protein
MSRSRVDEPRSGASPILNGPGGQPMPHTTGLQPHGRHVPVAHHVTRSVHAEPCDSPMSQSRPGIPRPKPGTHFPDMPTVRVRRPTHRA